MHSVGYTSPASYVGGLPGEQLECLRDHPHVLLLQAVLSTGAAGVPMECENPWESSVSPPVCAMGVFER